MPKPKLKVKITSEYLKLCWCLLWWFFKVMITGKIRKAERKYYFMGIKTNPPELVVMGNKFADSEGYSPNEASIVLIENEEEAKILAQHFSRLEKEQKKQFKELYNEG